MLYLETTTFKKFTCLPRLGKTRKQVQLSIQSSSSLPDSPHGCWECLACQVTHAEQEPKSPSLLVKMKHAPCWKTTPSEALQLWMMLQPHFSAIRQSAYQGPLSALSVGKMYNRDRPSCLVPEHPTFLYTFIAQITHTNRNIYMKQAMIKYMVSIFHRPLSQENPWVTLHFFDLQFCLWPPELFWPPVLSWLICSSAVSCWDIFQFWLCPASSIWCCSSWCDCNWLSLPEEKRWFLRLWWSSVAGALQSQIGGLN